MGAMRRGRFGAGKGGSKHGIETIGSGLAGAFRRFKGGIKMKRSIILMAFALLVDIE